MNPPPNGLIYSQDAALVRRLSGLLNERAALYHAGTPAQLEKRVAQIGPSLVLMDARAEDFPALLAHLCRSEPAHVLIVLGEPRSDPVLEASMQNVFAVELLEPERMHFQALVGRGFRHLELQQENALLRAEARRPPPPPPETPAMGIDTAMPVQFFARALRNFDNVSSLADNIVEGLVAAARVTRAGLFATGRAGDCFKLRAGVCCLETAQNLQYEETHPFVLWLGRNAHLFTRDGLESMRDPGERLILKQVLDEIGAEVVVPLLARGRILGWFFVGYRATGWPYNYADLENFAVLAEHIATTLENALLYEAVALQKTLAETLLHTMEHGIVAASDDGVVRWFNRAAELILNLPAAEVLGHAVDGLGSRLSDLFRRTLAREEVESPQQWSLTWNKKLVKVEIRPLLENRACLGAVALIRDASAEQLLAEREEQLRRGAFWNDLAASMSHEIRNPLTAIKTFAQLLPERYNDAEFRDEFSKLVNHEVDRLTGLIDQINSFAHPPPLKQAPLDICTPMQTAIALASARQPIADIKLELQAESNLPMVTGNEQALAEGFSHLLVNALEALHGRTNGEIAFSAQRGFGNDGQEVVRVIVRDNGPGIPPAIRANVFSPFCTTKARGMGLGLSIAQRTVFDHNGQINIDTSERGTRISIDLPVQSPRGTFREQPPEQKAGVK